MEEIDGTPTIAMELVTGGTLQEKVKQRGPLPVPAAVDAILQIIAGLEAAQAIGILHRDIKPGNCFEDTDGTIKIGDFGLSISSAARAETSVTAAGAMVGTPAFCSPEQLRGEELNARSDLYSVGVTLFYLLTARVPFDGHNLAQLTANVLEKHAPSPRQFRKEVPSGLAKAVLRCLEKQPGERFRSYDELRQALAPYSSSAAPTPATLGLRFLAGLLDMLFLGVISWIAMLARFGSLMGMTDFMARRSAERFVWMLGGLFVGVLYYAITEGFWGTTVGKMICRLRVIGPDNGPPGLRRGLVRGIFYVVLPVLPFWVVSRGDPYALVHGSTLVQYAVQFSYYLVLALLFCTVRRRNGFAAVHDLATQTRVISRTAFQARPLLAVSETAPAAVETKPQVGPYHVLEPLGKSGDAEWLLGYDLRLLRKVWLRVVPPGTPPVPAPWRNRGRAGRLRWLTGRRSSEENWDAFEGVTGQPLVKLAVAPQPWSHVRYWIQDLASEISVAAKDGTLPGVLAVDRVWITGEGRAKLLDFPAPGLVSAERANEPTSQQSNVAGLPALLPSQAAQPFLDQVAAAALIGDASAKVAGEAAVPLPLHARAFLKALPQLADADAVIAALKPLLQRLAAISRWRRAAVVAGCAVWLLFISVMSFLMFSLGIQWHRTNPGYLELSTLLKQRSSLRLSTKSERRPGDQQYAVFIATHYRTQITNEAVWSSPAVLSMVKGDARRFAEQSVAEHPAPTEKEIAEADEALKDYVHRATFPEFTRQPGWVFMLAVGATVIYVVIPAWLVALLFRGGLVQRIANVTFVRRDGARASRLRVFWRALVAWSPLALPLFLSSVSFPRYSVPGAVLGYGVVCALAVISVVLPRRGLPDRLAGTWPVPR